MHLLHNFKRDLTVVDCLLQYSAGAEPDQRNISFLPYGQSRKGSSYLHISCVFRGLLKKGALFSMIRCLSTVWGRRYCPLIPWYWRPSTYRRKKVLYYKTALNQLILIPWWFKMLPTHHHHFEEDFALLLSSFLNLETIPGFLVLEKWANTAFNKSHI